MTGNKWPPLKFHTADSTFEFEVNSPYQKLILISALTKHASCDGCRLENATGEIITCVPHHGTQSNKVTLFFKNEKEFTLFTATTNDLDMLTIIVNSTARGLDKIEQHKLLSGKWVKREPGAFFREGIIKYLRGMSPQEIQELFTIQDKYGEYIPKLLAADRADLLEALHLM